MLFRSPPSIALRRPASCPAITEATCFSVEVDGLAFLDDDAEGLALAEREALLGVAPLPEQAETAAATPTTNSKWILRTNSSFRTEMTSAA